MPPGASTRRTSPGGGDARFLTIPNGLSVLRLAGVPVFLWLVLGLRADGLALLVLVVAGATDWLDGYVARRFDQGSRLGELLDPAVDRLYILATLVGLSVREVIPWWLAVAIVGRDILLAPVLAVLARHGVVGLPVHFLGKVATFALLVAFPVLLLGETASAVTVPAAAFGWALAIWGTGLYWCAGFLYLDQARRVLRAAQRAERSPTAPA